MIVQAIKKKISENFDGYEVYEDEMMQGYRKPCFFVQIITGTRKKEIQSYQDSIEMDIQCFLAEDTVNRNTKYEEIRESLSSLLEYIKVNDTKMIRGINMNSAIKEGVFHFYVTYRYYLQIQDRENNKMDSMDVKGCVK